MSFIFIGISIVCLSGRFYFTQTMGLINKRLQLFKSVFYPALFVILLWVVKAVELITDTSFADYGLYPQTIHGLIGIITSPLIHGDVPHLIANSIPLLILGTIIFYFYEDIAFQLFFWIYIITGIWVWVAAREAYHIGASGIIYGFETFLFFSGVFRKDPKLSALSLLVIFLYGSTVWGMLPLQKGVSWESHAFGALAGLITAYNFRKEGPPDKEYDFGDDEENESLVLTENEIIEEPTAPPTPGFVINYEYIKKKEEAEGFQ